MGLLSNLSGLFGYSYNYNYDYSGGLGSSSAKAAAGAFAGIFIVYIIIMLLIGAYTIICNWKVFTKAGREGWKAIIPLYNAYVLTEIAGYNGLLFLICLIPAGALVWSIMVNLKLATAFGKDTGFAIGLILLNPIFMGILAFGSAQYVGTGAAPVAPAGPAGPAPAAPAAPAADPNASSLKKDEWLNEQK